AVVYGNRLVGHRFVVVNAENDPGHRNSPMCLVTAVVRKEVARNQAGVERSTPSCGGAENVRASGPAKIRASSPTTAITPACSHRPAAARKKVRTAATAVHTPAST